LEPNPCKFGTNTQEPLPENKSPPLDEKNKKYIQKIVGTFLYYCPATDPTIQQALSELASQQTKATKQTLQQ